MTTEYQRTREEEAYVTYLDEIWETLSDPARTIIGEAQLMAYGAHMVRSYGFDPRDYEEAMHEMRLAAEGITEGEDELLGRLWRSALAAAASIDPLDRTPAASRADRGDFHWYFRMLSGMVEKVWTERKVAELERECAERRWKRAQEKGIDEVDFEDIPKDKLTLGVPDAHYPSPFTLPRPVIPHLATRCAQREHCVAGSPDAGAI